MKIPFTITFLLVGSMLLAQKKFNFGLSSGFLFEKTMAEYYEMNIISGVISNGSLMNSTYEKSWSANMGIGLSARFNVFEISESKSVFVETKPSFSIWSNFVITVPLTINVGYGLGANSNSTSDVGATFGLGVLYHNNLHNTSDEFNYRQASIYTYLAPMVDLSLYFDNCKLDQVSVMAFYKQGSTDMLQGGVNHIIDHNSVGVLVQYTTYLLWD